MTVVEAPPDTGTTTGTPDAAGTEPPAVGGLAGVLGTVDHVGLGRLWVAASLLFLLVAAAAGALIGAERLDAGEIDLLDDAFAQTFSLHGTAAIFLFLLPAFVGVATAVVPLQLGASTVAFPRAASAAFWGWFLSSGVLVASYVIDGGLGGDDRDGVLLWTVAFAGVVVSLLVGVVSVLTTVVTLRTAGMSLDRVPPFSWTMLVAGSIWLLSLPVLVAGLILYYVEVRYGPGIGAASTLRWAFGAPQVFAFALPAAGLVLEAAPVAAATRQRNRGVVFGALAAAAILAFGAHLAGAAVDGGVVEDALYVGAAFALVLPFLAIAGGVADTLRRGRLNLTSPLLFGVVALLALLVAAVVNAVRVVDALDLVGTTADTAVTHLALAGGAVGLLGALHHWSSKLFGSVFGEGAGRIAALLLLLGGVVLGGADLVSGFLDQPAGILGVGDVEDGVEALNAVALVGGAVVILGVLVALVNIVGGTARSGDDDVPADPWGTGQTLEWRTASPPAPGGPGPIEPIRSAEPLLDDAEVS